MNQSEIEKMKPRSYMTDAERDELRAGGLSENGICCAESEAADKAGDGETAWAWLACAELPAHSLAFLKKRHGSQFIRDMGFQTKNADEAYGSNWLDR
ncbi:MAG: hypothetical protein LBV49_12550 [Azonexus sp.]|jgi:hypothetical protein|nr:hypothetical protein [Azonexus sp.]